MNVKSGELSQIIWKNVQRDDFKAHKLFKETTVPKFVLQNEMYAWKKVAAAAAWQCTQIRRMTADAFRQAPPDAGCAFCFTLCATARGGPPKSTLAPVRGTIPWRGRQVARRPRSMQVNATRARMHKGYKVPPAESNPVRAAAGEQQAAGV